MYNLEKLFEMLVTKRRGVLSKGKERRIRGLSKKKSYSRYVCSDCGGVFSSWTGKCSRCGKWGTLEEEEIVQISEKGVIAPRDVRGFSPVQIVDIPEVSRLSSEMEELDRVLGGGWVPGGAALLAGDPGIGKSTLLLQVCGAMAREGKRILYVSGEESLSQVASRAKRIGALSSSLDLCAEENPELFLASLEKYDFLVVDSVQAMRLGEVESWPGTPTQVRESARVCIAAAKARGVPLVLIGHVTKGGAIAGPKLLEHMVDTVLTFGGDEHQGLRMLRASKNRFGSTQEMGLFEMRQEGLFPVDDPGLLFWNREEEGIPGVAFGVVLEGSRSFVMEIQALACETPFPYPKRASRGIESSRVQLLLAVLEKRCGYASQKADMYINVTGGLNIKDPAGDLPLALAMASSLAERPLPEKTCFLGEVGLAGEIRPVPQGEQRLKEAFRLGFSQAYVSKRASIPPEMEHKVMRISHLAQALEVIL